MEACATAHFWARELRALGHDVRLMPAQYVKAYLRRGKNDAADAAAICEAVTRPSMRFVPVKEEAQQAGLMLHRVRDLLVRQRTQLINAIRGHLAEFGIIEAQGPWNVPRLLAAMEEASLPELARGLVRLLAGQLDEVELRIDETDAQIMAWHKADPVSQRLATIPGIGPLAATAIAATVPDPAVFRSGREFAAWLGLVPRQNSTGGKTRLGRTSRQGDAYIRRLLVIGAQSALWCSKATKANPWIQALLAKRPRLVVAVALGQQDGAHRLGHHGAADHLPGRGRDLGRDRQADACEGRRAMAWSVAPTDRGKPGEVEGLEPEDLLRSRSAEPIGACGPCRPRTRPDT